MIIKIEGLPEGQKIKHINVDISFEDGEAVVKTKADPVYDTPKPDVKFDNTVEINPIKGDYPSEMPMIPGNREKKEIPPEMQDMEF